MMQLLSTFVIMVITIAIIVHAMHRLSLSNAVPIYKHEYISYTPYLK